ncbi:hypothetical protein TNCV_3927131 [Trichonephila clavipes]|nr:hypothetical protein TNCV_3927131 [Trichonephila clavipes]
MQDGISSQFPLNNITPVVAIEKVLREEMCTDLHVPLFPDEVYNIPHFVHFHVCDGGLVKNALVKGARQEVHHDEADDQNDCQGQPEGLITIWREIRKETASILCLKSGRSAGSGGTSLMSPTDKNPMVSDRVNVEVMRNNLHLETFVEDPLVEYSDVLAY